MTTSEQQAVPVAQEQESALATAFYLLDTLAGEGLSQACDDGRTIEADDTVHALCSAFYMEPDVGWYRDLAAELASLPCKSGEGAEFVAGPIWAEAEDDCFTAEIQTVGGHNVVATVHGATRDEAQQRQRAVLAALLEKPHA